MKLPVQFGDDGQPVPAVAFDFDSLDEAPADADAADESAVRQETVLRLVAWLASGRVSALAVGRRVLLLNHVLAGSPGRQRDLAKRLGVGEARVSQAMKSLRRGLRGLQGADAPAAGDE